MELTDGELIGLLIVNAIIAIIAILTCIKYLKESDDDM